MNDGRGVNAVVPALPGVEQRAQPGHDVARARCDDRRLQPQRLPVGPVPDQRGARTALREGFGIFRFHGQREVGPPGVGGFGHAINGNVGRAHGIRPERARDLVYGI